MGWIDRLAFCFPLNARYVESTEGVGGKGFLSPAVARQGLFSDNVFG